MNKKSLIIVLDAHLPYVRNTETSGTVEESWLFNGLTFTYLPLLRSFAAMERDGVPFHIGIALSPELAEMFADPLLQDRYCEHLARSIDYAENLLAGNAITGLKRETLERHLELLRKNALDFEGVYKKDVIKQLDYFAERGFVELLAAPATPCFFPFYRDIPEAIDAQMEVGLMACRKRFSSIPEGFWLPALGWFPGVEKPLRAYGFHYTIVENTALLFSKEPPEAGVFAPAACENGFTVFPRDSFASDELASGECGFCVNPVYMDTDRDIGFTLAAEELAPLFDASLGRRATGFRFFSRGAAAKEGEAAIGAQDEDAGLYNPDMAALQVEADAKAFLDKSCETLKLASEQLGGGHVCRTCAFPATFFGVEWLEGIDWLEKTFRLASSMYDVSFERPAAVMKAFFAERRRRKAVSPVFSTWLDKGYADELLNSANDWAYAYIKKATARMVDIAGRFSESRPLSERILNAAAREVLLAQSIEWPILMNDPVNFEYARARLEESIKAFTTVYDSLGSNEVSTEWLTEIEKKRPLFPFINYRAFCRRK